MKIDNDLKSRIPDYSFLSEEEKSAGSITRESIRDQQRRASLIVEDKVDISPEAVSASKTGQAAEGEQAKEEQELAEIEKKFRNAGGGSSKTQSDLVEKLEEQVKEAKEKLQEAQAKLQKALGDSQKQGLLAGVNSEVEAAKMEVNAAQTELQALQAALAEAVSQAGK